MAFIFLDQVKEYLRENFKSGCECPACGQRVQEYKRQITPEAVKCLFTLYGLHKNIPEETWHHIRTLGSLGGDFAKLRFWGLVEEQESPEDPTKRTSGWWKITEQGRRFVHGRYHPHKFTHIYNGKVRSQSGPRVSVVDCLKNKFSYEELMGAV